MTMVLILVNLLLAVALSAAPPRTTHQDVKLFSCCRGVGPEAYCCRRCCWLTKNCTTNADCNIIEERM